LDLINYNLEFIFIISCFVGNGFLSWMMEEENGFNDLRVIIL